MKPYFNYLRIGASNKQTNRNHFKAHWVCKKKTSPNSEACNRKGRGTSPCVTWRLQRWWLSESPRSSPQAGVAALMRDMPLSGQTPGAGELVEIWNAARSHLLPCGIWRTCLPAFGQSNTRSGAQGGGGSRFCSLGGSASPRQWAGTLNSGHFSGGGGMAKIGITI